MREGVQKFVCGGVRVGYFYGISFFLWKLLAATSVKFGNELVVKYDISPLEYIGQLEHLTVARFQKERQKPSKTLLKLKDAQMATQELY